MVRIKPFITSLFNHLLKGQFNCKSENLTNLLHSSYLTKTGTVKF
jgi:hypothetical protein